MKKLLALLIIIFVWGGCTTDTPFEEELKSERNEKSLVQKNLKVVTQNVGWLTDPGGGYEGDFLQMASYLISNHGDADVIVLQECFTLDGGNKEYMYNQFSQWMYSRFNYKTDWRKARNSYKNGHGIWIFSKYPIVNESHQYFHNCHGNPPSSGSDCGAKKGWVHIKLDLGDNHIANVLGTHLDAGNDYYDRNARRVQLLAIDNYVKDRPDRYNPFILAGDFNINGNISGTEESYNYTYNYEFLKNTINSWADFSDNVYTHLRTGPGRTVPDGALLDYIFVRQDFLNPVSYHVSSRKVDKSPVTQDITDHYNVRTEYNFNFSTTNSDAKITSCYQYQYGYVCEHDGQSGQYEWKVNGSNGGTGTRSHIFFCPSYSTPLIQLIKSDINVVVDESNSCTL